jgi:glycerol-3-phosphate dehydrogenase
VEGSDEGVLDVVVIGGGVVGCAVARRLTLDGATVMLLEKGPDILSGSASKGNSAILHTGFDAPEGSLELHCVRDGYREYLEIHDRLNLPVLETGAVLAAWTEEEAERLPGILETAHRNGVADVGPLTVEELYAREPSLAPGARAALRIPGEHVIDPWSAPFAYVSQAIANGAEARFDCEVLGADLGSHGWVLDTSRGRITARAVVNCAGLYGDLVDAMAGLTDFVIQPRKGQFVIMDKSAFGLVRSIILPVPTERSKGVLLAPTAFGNLLIGPTAEDVGEREAPTVTRGALKGLLDQAATKVPAVRDHEVTAVFAGLRPASRDRDYQIRAHPELRWITVGGIRSTGLTGALGIARHVADLYRERLEGVHTAIDDPVWTPVPNLSEHRARPYQRPAAGPILCHCEFVTRQEVEEALRGPLPPRSLGALRRRTRVLLGRCQGFYCGAEIAELTKGRFQTSLSVGESE